MLSLSHGRDPPCKAGGGELRDRGGGSERGDERKHEREGERVGVYKLKRTPTQRGARRKENVADDGDAKERERERAAVSADRQADCTANIQLPKPRETRILLLLLNRYLLLNVTTRQLR